MSSTVRKMRVASTMAIPMLMVCVGVKSMIICVVEGNIDSSLGRV